MVRLQYSSSTPHLQSNLIYTHTHARARAHSHTRHTQARTYSPASALLSLQTLMAGDPPLGSSLSPSLDGGHVATFSFLSDISLYGAGAQRQRVLYEYIAIFTDLRSLIQDLESHPRIALRFQPLGVAREHTRAPDIAQSKVKHDHPLQSDASARMRRCAQSERFDVMTHTRDGHAGFCHALFEEGGVVHSLGAREDLFAAHEEVVRVRVALWGKRQSG